MTSEISISLDDALNGRGVSAYDVLNGQGNHIKNTTGNVCYRRLVSANKHLYNHCHDRDKIKISMGIVAAVRRKGGRFLAYDAHNKMFYADIKDKQATEKTSQALRDAKREILPVGIPIPQVGKATELPKELYSSFTDQVLQSQSLHVQDGCYSHSFPTVTDIDAAPKNERDTAISERDTAISSISIGDEINKVLEYHDTRMTSGELCKELGLVEDNDVEMISTEHCLEFINGININIGSV